MVGNIASEGVGALTYGQLIAFVVVGLIFIGIFNEVMRAITTLRLEKKRRDEPVTTLEEKIDKQGEIIGDHSEKLRHDYERINELENGTRIMMRALMAILSHDISGNSIDKLKESMEEIHKFLLNR